MKYIKVALLMVAALTGQAAAAQNLTTGYFNTHYLYRHTMNPAFGAERNYVTMPALGRLSLGVGANVSASDLLYRRDGQTVTLLHPDVSAHEAMRNLPSTTLLGSQVSATILGAGFRAFGGFNTVEINVKSRVGLTLPKDLFSFLKEGASNRTYDISGVGADAEAYTELALGHARQITEKWQVGAKMKVLLGAGYLRANFHKAQLTLGQDEWSAVTNAELRGSMMGATFEHDVNENTQHQYVSGLNTDDLKPGVNGVGVAFDLGAAYKLNDDWQFSAALLDLGFISWGKTLLASTNGDQEVHTSKYAFSVDDNAPNSFEKEGDRIGDDLSRLYELNDMGAGGSHARMLGATVNLGAVYTLPMYNKLQLGLLNTTYIRGRFTTTDFRLSANVAPLKQFSASASFGLGTYGTSLGWMLNYAAKGFSIYVGSDYTPLRVDEQHIPMNSTHLAMGINFPF